MDIQLNKKHLDTIKEEKEVLVKTKHKKSTKSKNKEVDICNAYIKGTPFKVIAKEFGISAGQLYSILRKNGVPQRQESRTYEKVKHIIDNKEVLGRFLKDYDQSTLEFVMWKYKLKRNQVYYILDSNGVDRKRIVDRVSKRNNHN